MKCPSLYRMAQTTVCGVALVMYLLLLLTLYFGPSAIVAHHFATPPCATSTDCQVPQ